MIPTPETRDPWPYGCFRNTPMKYRRWLRRRIRRGKRTYVPTTKPDQKESR